ncbi:hypothetical protein FOZ62_007098, partial [Perkinsus olseni]
YKEGMEVLLRNAEAEGVLKRVEYSDDQFISPAFVKSKDRYENGVLVCRLLSDLRFLNARVKAPLDWSNGGYGLSYGSTTSAFMLKRLNEPKSESGSSALLCGCYINDASVSKLKKILDITPQSTSEVRRLSSRFADALAPLHAVVASQEKKFIWNAEAEKS